MTDKMIKSLTEAVNGVTQLDALFILAAGNMGTPITTYPQMLGQSNARVVVVGAVDAQGNTWSDSSTANWVKINAIGRATNVISQSEVGPWGPEIVDGTSFSEYLLRTSKEWNSSDHDNRCARDNWSIGLPTYDR